VKLGLQMFTAYGPNYVREIAGMGFDVFLDLKLHDIPNTVAGAIRAAVPLGVSMLTVHAAGGVAMLRAACEAASDAASAPAISLSGRPRILAVTVLTSHDAAALGALGVARTPADQAAALATAAWIAGCDGVVASPHEASSLRELLGPQALIVTPAIRGASEEKGDQRRSATAREALDAGASHLVIGRPILLAPDPLGALEAILASIGSADPG
jgi:orotidine-5'-phosphate decarboxylase